MRRPRAFTCSKLKAEPLPPPTRKPLGYDLTSATTSVQASSPCKCGKCGESPATASSSSLASSSSSQSPSSSRVREATSAGGQGSRTPPLAEALGPPNNGSPATAGRPRFRRLPRNAHLPRRSVFNNPPPLPAPPSTSLLAAGGGGGELEGQGEERAGGLLAPPPPPSDQRKRGSDRGEPRGSFAAPTAGKQLAASAAASTPTKSVAAGATAAAAPTTEAGGSTSRAAGTKPATAAVAAAAATPVAVSVDAAGDQKSFTTMYCEAGDSVASFIRPGVTFIKVDSAGVASVCDVSIMQDNGSVNGGSSRSRSSNNAAGSLAGMKGFDECKAPATDASGVFSMGSSSSRAAFGRRRRRVGG
ncbi:unnamed protein product [Ectocarpus sp. 8 AP-2014]